MPLFNASDLCVDPFQHLGRIHAAQQKDDPGDPVRVLVLSENSPAFQRAKLQSARGSSQKDRRTIFRQDHDVAEILQRPDQPDAAHDVTLLAADHDAAAGIGIVGLNRRNHLLE